MSSIFFQSFLFCSWASSISFSISCRVHSVEGRPRILRCCHLRVCGWHCVLLTSQSNVIFDSVICCLLVSACRFLSVFQRPLTTRTKRGIRRNPFHPTTQVVYLERQTIPGQRG